MITQQADGDDRVVLLEGGVAAVTHAESLIRDLLGHLETENWTKATTYTRLALD